MSEEAPGESAIRSILTPGMRLGLSVIALLVLILAIWLGNVLLLNSRLDTSCVASREPTHVLTGMFASPAGSIVTQELQLLLDNYTQQTGSGLQATIILADGSSWAGVSGVANRREACPMSPNHHLYLGDISELCTAVLVMQQVQSGAISLDDRIDRWLDLPYAQDVTVRMLLSHRSGIPNYCADLGTAILLLLFPAKDWQSDELLDKLVAKDLRFEPGTLCEHSISNPLLLGLILEEETGRPYATLLQERLVKPLGLQDTYFLHYPPDLPIAAAYHESFMGLIYPNVTPFRRSIETGASFGGGVLSTSRDVAELTHALFTEALLSEDTLSEMLGFPDDSGGPLPDELGLGLGIQRLKVAEADIIGHKGSLLGYSGIAAHDPQLKATIVLLSNLSTADQSQLPQQLLPQMKRQISDYRPSP